MEGLAGRPDPRLLVGASTGDDAAVYRLTDEIAIVQTVDYITPMVDDPFLFGQVAAANALSDVYAMGGRPLTAMNICSFPRKGSPGDYRRILQGGLAKIEEAGALLVGGQTVEGAELVYGLSVTGTVHPGKVWTNAGARPGDALILTKPLGTGVLINAVKTGKGGRKELLAACESMRALNRSACEAASAFSVHAATDITGFALAGHAWNIARESNVRLHFASGAIPSFPGTLAMIQKGVRTGLTRPNRENLGPRIRFAGGIDAVRQELFFDPQTSGGLLLCVPGGQAQACLAAILAAGGPAPEVPDAALVGSIKAGEPGIDVEA